MLIGLLDNTDPESEIGDHRHDRDYTHHNACGSAPRFLFYCFTFLYSQFNHFLAILGNSGIILRVFLPCNVWVAFFLVAALLVPLALLNPYLTLKVFTSWAL